MLRRALERRLARQLRRGSADPDYAQLRSSVTLAGVMAKAKRRKLRARRSKANHGRKPNAGRG